MGEAEDKPDYALSAEEYRLLDEVLEDYLSQDGVRYSPYEHEQQRASETSELHVRLMRHFEPVEYERRYGKR